MRKLLERVRRTSAVRWPWRIPKAQQRAAFLPTHGTGFTVHRDAALRLRNLNIDLRAPFAGQEAEGDVFKIRIASPEARRDASTLVRKRYADRGYLTSTTLVTPHSCTFSAYDEGRLAGTVTLRLDSEDGLAADGLYGDETRRGAGSASLRGLPSTRRTSRIRCWRRCSIPSSCSRRSSADSTTR